MKRVSLVALLILMLMGPSALRNDSRAALGAALNPKPMATPTPKPTPKATPKPTPKATPKATPSTGNTSGGTKKPSPSPAGNLAGNEAGKKSDPLAARVFSFPAIIFLVVFGFVALGLGAWVGNSLGETGSDVGLRGLEAAILAVLGAILARFFIGLLLSLAGDSSAAQIAIGWGFFLFPGAVDTVSWLVNKKLATTPEFLMWLATFVGAFTGMMNGIWRIHDWKGIGYLAFPLDVTWGLAGATTGSLLHLVNFAWADHAADERYEAHRYLSGMRLKNKFAFTQGPVMSNLKVAPTQTAGAKHDSLYYHERTHVWQNRIFGPLFTLTYLGWMAVWLVPGLIAAILTRDIEAIQSFCYFNNPWEAWAYLVGPPGKRTDHPSAANPHPLIWRDAIILLLSVPFFGGMIGLFISVIMAVW